MTLPPLHTLAPIAIIAALAAAPAFAQAPPPPGAAPPPPPGAVPPPPPGVAPPPQTAGGPSVILDRNGAFVHVDVRCTSTETTRACIDVATQLYDKLNGAPAAR